MICPSFDARIEAVRLRVKDIDFDYRQIRVINGKGGKHRVVTLADVKTTEIYTHVLKQGAQGVKSPLSLL